MENEQLQLRETINELERQKNKLNVIANMSADVIFEYDILSQTMHYINRNVPWITSEYVNEYPQYILGNDIINLNDLPNAEQYIEDINDGKEEICAEFRRKINANEYHWLEIKGVTIYNENGNPISVLGSMVDIQKRKDKELKLEKLSKVDSLTNLYNQNTIRNLIKNSLLKRKSNDMSALFIIDIDSFKDINDGYGHLYGDAVLCSVSDEMKRLFQSNGLFGRIGGDEFIVYIQHITRSEAEKCAQQLCDNIQKIYETIEVKKMKISCSIGISFAIGNSKPYEVLFEEADKALYYVKKNGKNNFDIFDGSNKYQDPDKRESLQLCGCDLEKFDNVTDGMHDLLLFSMDILEKTQNIQNAIRIILERIGKYFKLDGAVITRRNPEGKAIVLAQWMEDKANLIPENTELIGSETFTSINEQYDEFEVAQIKKDDFLDPRLNVYGIQSILTVRNLAHRELKGDVTFLDRHSARTWSYEEKTVIRGLATIFYNYFAKTNAIKKKEEAEYFMKYDAMTGLPNFVTFKDMANQLTIMNEEKNYVLVYSGFSNFQYINDRYGYAIGDAVLARFGKYLCDEISAIRLCSHVTGDEFVLLLEGKEIEVIQNDLIACCKHFANTMELEAGISNLVIISGLAQVSGKDEYRIAVSIDNANLARKMIKANAETDCAVFTERLKKYMTEKVKITSNMAIALEKEEFQVYIQPKIDLHSDKVIGAEALIRWMKKDGTMIYPDQFIPIFEENGFITKIDFYVLQRVLIYLRKRIENKLAVVPISVNFSRRHQDNPEYVRDIIALLEEYDLPKELLEIELTESVVMSDMNSLMDSIKILRENNISVSIDDFGSGYSSLNVLSAVPADIIKMDRVFLQNNTDKNITILKYVIKMMKDMGFKVIAEGVETQEQVALLKEVDCDMAQGYYYAKPMPIWEFHDFLRENETIHCH